MIEGGAKVTLQMLIAHTGGKLCCHRFLWDESSSSGIDKPGLVPGRLTGGAANFLSKEEDGKTVKTSVYCKFGTDGGIDVSRKKDSGAFTATMKKGRKPGDQLSIYLHGMETGLGTEYTYTWTPRSEAKVRKITSGEKPAPKGSLTYEE